MTWSLNLAKTTIPEARQAVTGADIPNGVKDYIDDALDAFPDDAHVNVTASGHLATLGADSLDTTATILIEDGRS